MMGLGISADRGREIMSTARDTLIIIISVVVVGSGGDRYRRERSDRGGGRKLRYLII
jgi:hypothetical protein